MPKHDIDRPNPHEAIPSGEDSPHWTGGKSSWYGPNWHTQRSKCLERDNHECQVCGMDQKEHKEKYNEELHAHHITPRTHYIENGTVNNKCANRLENLITLCRDCHTDWEGIPVIPH